MKYLFSVVYKDGTTYHQNQSDTSLSEPEKRSSFYDVDVENVQTFTLTGEGHTYLVDITDGHFEVDGVSFWMHELPLKDFKLIYFRRHTHTFSQNMMEEIGHVIVFRVGWEAVDADGKKYEQVMQIL